MKKQLLIVLTLWSYNAMAQAPEYAWVNTSSGSQDISADLNSHYSVIDHANNAIYCASGFNGDIDFGSGPLTSYGSNDIAGLYLAKYNLDGTLIWAKSYINTSAPAGMTLDASGNVLICGNSYSDTVRFNNQYLLNGNTDNAVGYIVKLDPNGNTLWLKGSGNEGADIKTSAIISDNSGNVYTTGTVIESAGTFCGNTLTDGFFVIKLNAGGVSQWIKQSSDYNISDGRTMAITGNGDCIITGTHANPFTLGSFTIPYNVGSSYWDMFIVKVTPSGVFQSAMGMGLWQGPEMPHSLTLDAQDNMYISGLDIWAPDDMDSYYEDRQFLEKRAPDGTLLWHKSYEAAAQELIAPTIITDHYTAENGDTYALFQVNDSTDFDGTIVASNPDNLGLGILAAVVKYDTDGNQEWVTATADHNYLSWAGAHSIVADHSENVYYSGYLAGSMNFGPILRETADANDQQFLLAKLGDEPVSVIELKKEKLVVYPNPTSGSTTIKLDQAPENVIITDLLGKVVYKGISATIDLSYLPNGMYTVAVAANGEVLQTRLVKQ